jgi:hypothetical protein
MNRPTLLHTDVPTTSVRVALPRTRKRPATAPVVLKGYSNPIHPPKAASAPVEGRTKLVPTSRGIVVGYAGFGIVLFGSGYLVLLAASAFS